MTAATRERASCLHCEQPLHRDADGWVHSFAHLDCGQPTPAKCAHCGQLAQLVFNGSANVWTHAMTGMPGCMAGRGVAEPADTPRFGEPSPPCPRCGRDDCATTGTPGRWRCWDCETEFRDPPRFDVIADLERRADRPGHQPSTLIATNGTRALCADGRLAGAMAKAIFAELVADDLNDNVERRTA